MYTLVIIDMQAHFYVKDATPVTLAVKREIEKAIKDDAHILCVEYAGSGKTLPILYDLFKEYSKGYLIEKMGVDGSQEVMNFVQKKNLPTNFKATGVNTSACVRGTVIGLLDKMPDCTIDLISDACADMSYDGSQNQSYHDNALKEYRLLKRVNVVMPEK